MKISTVIGTFLVYILTCAPHACQCMLGNSYPPHVPKNLPSLSELQPPPNEELWSGVLHFSSGLFVLGLVQLCSYYCRHAGHSKSPESTDHAQSHYGLLGWGTLTTLCAAVGTGTAWAMLRSTNHSNTHH